MTKGFSSERLRDLMVMRGKSVVELANEIGVSRQTVFYWRTGERTTPNSETASRLALALNTTVQYLMGETDDPSPVQKTMAPEVAAIVNVVNKLSDAEKRRMLAIAEALLLSGKQEAEQRARNSQQLSSLLAVGQNKVGDAALRDALAEYAASNPDFGFMVDGGAETEHECAHVS